MSRTWRCRIVLSLAAQWLAVKLCEAQSAPRLRTYAPKVR
jgi:hypothetical protein